MHHHVKRQTLTCVAKAASRCGADIFESAKQAREQTNRLKGAVSENSAKLGSCKMHVQLKETKITV